MPNREKVIKGLEQFKADLKPFCGNRADWERFDAGIALLKEQETKPLRCKTCTMRDKTGFCHRWNIEVKEDDYCSFGAWKGQ